MRRQSLLGLLMCGLSITVSAADRDPLAAPRPELRTVEEQIEAHLRRLSSDSFAERNEATRQLTELGLPAIGPVTEAAESLDMELASRCVSILSRLSESPDAKIKAAALQALKRLKESENPLLAKRAEAALPQPKQNLQPRNGIIQLRVGGNVPIQNIQVRIQNQQIRGGRSVRTTIRNGVRETHVEEQNRQIQINDDNGKNIRIKVTEQPKNGEKKTSEYNAKDLEELKKNHPEGAKIYQEFTSVVPPALGVPKAPQPKEVQQRQQKIREELTKGQKEIQAIAEKLRQNAGQPGGPDPEVQQKLTEELREAQQRMTESIRKQAE